MWHKLGQSKDVLSWSRGVWLAVWRMRSVTIEGDSFVVGSCFLSLGFLFLFFFIPFFVYSQRSLSGIFKHLVFLH